MKKFISSNSKWRGLWIALSWTSMVSCGDGSLLNQESSVFETTQDDSLSSASENLIPFGNLSLVDGSTEEEFVNTIVEFEKSLDLPVKSALSSRNYIQEYREWFDRVDKNNDGKLDANEIIAYDAGSPGDPSGTGGCSGTCSATDRSCPGRGEGGNGCHCHAYLGLCAVNGT